MPVIQQADHANLLLEPETFLNNWLFHLASAQAGARFAITSQCTTVNCLSRRTPPLGPTFLRTRGATLGVYPLSRTTLKNATFCALPGPLEMTFDRLDGAAVDIAADPVLGRLAGRRAESGPAGYHAANEEIWRGLDVDHGVRRVQVDESMAAECVALHLADADGPVFQLLFNPRVRGAFLRAKRRIVAEPGNIAVNRAAPDFLWYRKGARLQQVVWGEDGPVLEVNGAPLPIPYEPGAVADALRAGLLYPDRILAYTVRSLLPGVVAVGGTSQQDYLPMYQRMLLDTHHEVPFLSAAEVHRLRRGDLSRLGGRALFEPTGEALEMIRHLGPSTPLPALAAEFLPRPVGEAAGGLRAARHVLRAIETRPAPVLCSQRAYS